jgi:hypothetical protein
LGDDYTRKNGAMPSLSMNLDPLRKGLLKVGFREDRLCNNLPIPGSGARVPLLAFSDQPFDSRTASVAVLGQQSVLESDIAAVRPLGAPLVFACLPDHYQLWLQGSERPRFHLRLTPRELLGFFEQEREQLAPDAIYRAKVWGRLERGFQLDFVDAGFLSLIEEEAGQKLTDLVERVVAETKHRLGWDEISEADGRWLLQSTFWLLAAKILQDKSVRGFVGLNLNEVEEVYDRLAKHYHSESPRPIPVGGQRRREALVAASDDIKRFGHCGAVSTEALGFLSESALIDRATRMKLGTHRTPTWLVDYIIGKLRPWIESDIAVEDRKVFEPACGHAGFLIGAMRLLSELLPPNWRQSRRAYLRERLHGLELDPRALEFARLSLTLADVPNPNGWALTEANMFKADLLEQGVADATIVLGNPPFEDFASNERRAGWLPNKAAETFRRVVTSLPAGGVFGFVLPQTFLHAKQADEVRRLLLKDYEISEISLFADKVFRYGEPESTVIVGRRLARTGAARTSIRYQRIREGQIEEFSRSYRPGSTVETNPERFASARRFSFLLPDLDEVWRESSSLPRFADIAEIGQGFSHKGDDDRTLPKGAIKESETEQRGLTPGFAGWQRDQMTHTLPCLTWLNLNPDTILASRWGVVGKPQVLLNYARVSRETWRLKGLIDERGRPVTSDFLVIRPKAAWSLAVLWALCNSPVANAFAYCHSNKRHVLAGDMRRMPVPKLGARDLAELEQAVAAYLTAARAVTAPATKRRRVEHKPQTQQMDLSIAGASQQIDQATDEQLRILHWRIDAEVLRLYNLPAPLERKILDLFSGIRRRGVPFEQRDYFPKGFSDLERLSDLLAITADWPKTNRRRAKLIDLEESGRLTPEQATELEHLQRLADARVSLLKPRQADAIDQQIEKLKRQGLWTE